MKIWLPQWGDTTMIRRKNFPMPSNRPLRRKGSWTWWKGHLPSRKQPIAAAAPLPNFVRARWRPLMKGTRFVPSMMVVLEVRTLTSNRTHRRKQLHQRWWIVCMVSTGSMRLPLCLQETTLPSPKGKATASGVDSSSQGGGTWSWPGPDTTLLILKADVSKAHRRIKILPSGWKYQVAQIDQQWWVNKVGTYGVASAQLYWGRMAALLLRLLYYSFPEVDWGFVFVDDFCWLLRSTNCNSLTPALLAFLVALGVPLSWKKTVLSEINTWLGFVINPSGPFVQMARDKHVIVLSLLQDLASGKVFSTKAIEKALGRIQWATATCPLAKPFLQPFWQWKSACKNAGQPGKLVRCLAVLLSELFSRQFPQMSPFSPWSDWTGASDASAEPFGTTWIGGWFSDLNTFSSTARCFWCSCWCPNNQQRLAGFTFLWSAIIKGMSIFHLEQCDQKDAKCSYPDGTGLSDLPSWAYACSYSFQERWQSMGWWADTSQSEGVQSCLEGGNCPSIF